jgi:RNA polymerase sigma-70 factor (ECF subfamily)
VDWSTQPDARLVEALADDASALAPLYDRHARLVFGLALAVLGSPDEAEDLTQEVFLSLAGPCGFDAARGTLPAFLTTLTRSRALDRLRQRGRRTRLLRASYEAAPPTAPPPGPAEQVSQQECTARVRAALDGLPAAERRAIELAYYQGLTQAEIADEVGAPLGTVKSWCRRGLLGLRDALADLLE